MTTLDARLNAYRLDLADERLRDKVGAERFTLGKPGRVVAPVADLLKAPDAAAGMNTQMIAGDAVRVFDANNGWSWVQADLDGYVGYVASDAVGATEPEPTQVVTAPRTFVYPGPDLRFPRVRALSIGSRLRVVGQAETRNTAYALLENGEAIIAAHLAPVEATAADYVGVAETLIHTPYLWGGASGFGTDCSGLVQLSMRMAGQAVLRDTDMQVASIGLPVDTSAGYGLLRRGDLVFWKGHVAIMVDGVNMIHASGHTMMVCLEPLGAAIERIGYLYGQPTAVRRPLHPSQ